MICGNKKTNYKDNVIDLRGKQKALPKPAKKWRIRNGQVVSRDMSTVDGVVLHQTAVWYGVSKRQVREAGGDEHKALHNRGLKIACHAIAFGGDKADLDCAHAVITNPLQWYVNHGSRLNKKSLGLEIEGKYPGLMKHSDERVPDHVIKAACDALRFLVEEGRKQGAPIKYVWAHRQSSPTRRDDPGEEIWQRVALDYGVKVLGLETQPQKTWGKGSPIPVEWESGGKGHW